MAPPSPPPPTKAQTRLIRRTWERVTEKRLEKDNPNVSASYAFGKAFYEALFVLEPELKSIFTNTLQQARVLTGILSYIARAPSVMPARYKDFASIKEMNSSYMIASSSSPPPPPVSSSLSTSPKSSSSSLSESQQQLKTKEDDDGDENELNKEEEAWMVERLQELGARHADYKVFQGSMFDHVGPALVEALQRRLASEYEPHIGEAWLKAHDYVSFHMKKGLQSRLVWEEALADDHQHFQYKKLHQQRRRSSDASTTTGTSAAKANNCSIQ